MQSHFLTELIHRNPELLNCGTALRIDNEPHLTLHVLNIGPGLGGRPVLQIAHYCEQNGDLKRDPEMCIALDVDGAAVSDFQPYFYRNDFAESEMEIFDLDDPKSPALVCLARNWDRDVIDKGFLSKNAIATLFA